MSSQSSEERWKDLNITPDEVERIGKALKDEKFRKLFAEYAEEISDPRNREVYENEIAQMEAERGMNIQFIHPKPGHVLKVQSKPAADAASVKTFINICQNEHMGKPTHEKKMQPNGKMGLQWHIPHSFCPMREDLDKKGGNCQVYDVVFHPDTYKMSSNAAFLNMIHDTALEGLERQFGIEIDRSSLVKMNNLKFKGQPHPTVLRTRKTEAEMNGEDKENASSHENGDPLGSFPYPYTANKTSKELADEKAKQVAGEKEALEQKKKQREEARSQAASSRSQVTSEDGTTIPEYTLTNQYGVDMADYTQSLAGTLMHAPNAPTSLVVSIHLPELKSAKPCTLDVTERHLSLETSEPIRYKLSLKLSYPVDDENGSAKFDKTKKRLIVTLPVKRDKLAMEISDAVKTESYSVLPEASSATLNGRSLIEELSSHKFKEDSTEESSAHDLDSAQPVESENSNAPSHSCLAKSDHTEDSVITAQRKSTEQSVTQSSTDDSNPTAIHLDDKVLYKLPPLNYDQDDDSVTLVLDVCRVSTESFRARLDGCQVEITFATYSPTGFPTHYYLRVVFPNVVTALQHSIGERNVVITVAKKQVDQWLSFTTFSADADTPPQSHEFLTQSHIEKELERLEQMAAEEATRSGQGHDNTQLADDIVVKSMNSRHLSIDIQESQAETTNVCSLEVVHKHSPPADMHGILKRTYSESGATDEPLTSPRHEIDGTEPLSPTDEEYVRERRKSVSFSEKVGEAKFKSQDTVLQMHKTLLSRKKKMRQRENRQSAGGKGRRRRNSSNSEYSSGDESNQNAGRRRRRHSSSASEDSRAEDAEQNEDDESQASINETDNEVGSTSPAAAASAEVDELNSDDDEGSNEDNNNEVKDDTERHDGENNSGSAQEGKAAGWSSADDPYVEKTKCAFDFDNSVIFDLDE